jgi:hypothetical protein
VRRHGFHSHEFAEMEFMTHYEEIQITTGEACSYMTSPNRIEVVVEWSGCLRETRHYPFQALSNPYPFHQRNGGSTVDDIHSTFDFGNHRTALILSQRLGSHRVGPDDWPGSEGRDFRRI